MAEISASLVKELRDATGAPMMDCKRALQDTNGDIEAAKRLLRERGMASAEKRAGRVTAEGKVGFRIADDGKRGTIVAAGAARFEAVDGARIEGYAHPPANKLGVLVQVRGGSPDLARKLAMHIAASSPQWIGRDDVPEDVVTSEREIFANTDEVRSKPEQAREKIVEGMLNKRFFADRVLNEQQWIHDTGKTVGQVLHQEGAEVLEFERFAL